MAQLPKSGLVRGHDFIKYTGVASHLLSRWYKLGMQQKMSMTQPTRLLMTKVSPLLWNPTGFLCRETLQMIVGKWQQLYIHTDILYKIYIYIFDVCIYLHVEMLPLPVGVASKAPESHCDWEGGISQCIRAIWLSSDDDQACDNILCGENRIPKNHNFQKHLAPVVNREPHY